MFAKLHVPTDERWGRQADGGWDELKKKNSNKLPKVDERSEKIKKGEETSRKGGGEGRSHHNSSAAGSKFSLPHGERKRERGKKV